MKPTANENRLDGKVIVVTGSTSGTGKAIALRCAWLGAAGIVITGRNADRGQAVVAEINQIAAETGDETKAIFVQAELTDEAQCRDIIQACDTKFGRVDGLVNVAGRGTRGSLEDTTVDLWDEMMNLHVRAPFLLTPRGVQNHEAGIDSGEHRQYRFRGGARRPTVFAPLLCVERGTHDAHPQCG